MIRGVAPALLVVLGLGACGRGGAARLEGKWKGKGATGVAPEAQAAASAFAVEMEIDVRGDQLTIITAREKQTGTYRVVKEEKSQVTIVTDKDGPNDAQTFTFLDDKTLSWNVLDGKTITFVRMN